LKKITLDRLIKVLAARYRDQSKRALWQDRVDLRRYSFITSDNPRNERRYDFFDILTGYESDDYTVIPTAIKRYACSGYAVMTIRAHRGKGHEDTKSLKTSNTLFQTGNAYRLL
jgi:UDP-N-acetylmuramyl tripeptide synthase